MEKILLGLEEYKSLTAGKRGSKRQAWQWEREVESSQPQPQAQSAKGKPQAAVGGYITSKPSPCGAFLCQGSPTKDSRNSPVSSTGAKCSNL